MSVMLGTPFAAFGAFLGLFLARLASPAYVLNIFAQIGLIMLVGLAAKNAILIVEFAKEANEREGLSHAAAAMEAAKLRLRPILMTAFAFILGVLPLVRAAGAGAEGRKVMGMAVFAGMLVATILGVILVPVLFVVVGRLSGGRKQEGRARAGGARAAQGGVWRPPVNRALLAAAALSAAACSFAPAYQRPDAGVPKEFRLATPGEAASIADLPWWEIFKDPTLQNLIREALTANQDLALAAARVDEARAIVGVARADFYPQVAGTARGGYGQAVSDELLPGSEERALYSLEASASWELDLWGRIRNSSSAAFADLLATEDVRRAVVLSLVSGVAQAYVELRALDLQLEIAKSNAETRRGTLDLFEARALGGIASDLEVNQARSDLAVTMAAIPETERFIWMKEHELSVLLGRPPGPIARGIALVDMPVVPDLPYGVPAQLLARRPDMLAAEQGIIAAGKRVGVARADRLPALSLTGFIALDARTVPDVFTPGPSPGTPARPSSRPSSRAAGWPPSRRRRAPGSTSRSPSTGRRSRSRCARWRTRLRGS